VAIAQKIEKANELINHSKNLTFFKKRLKEKDEKYLLVCENMVKRIDSIKDDSQKSVKVETSLK